MGQLHASSTMYLLTITKMWSATLKRKCMELHYLTFILIARCLHRLLLSVLIRGALLNNLKVTRIENKYLVDKQDFFLLEECLRSLMIEDRKKYTVSSLYFDSIDDTDLKEKLDGVLLREKYRIRIYDYQDEIIKFEVKRKNNNTISKESIVITRNEADLLMRGEYSFLLEREGFGYLADFMANNVYRPKTIVTYDRTAFYLPFNNIRITLDVDLRTSGFDLDLFSISDPKNFLAIKNEYFILEVKFHDYIPDFIARIIEPYASARSSLSKYAVSRNDNSTEIMDDDPVFVY